VDTDSLTAVAICALRFKAWDWLRATHPSARDDWSALVNAYLQKLTFLPTLEENLGCFFALQHDLHKFPGAEAEPSDAWLGYWQLFLALQHCEVPVPWREQSYINQWQACNAAQAANDVHKHIVDCYGGMQAKASYKWWKDLNKMQLGRYGEYLVKMELTKAGCEVYTSEVDDRGIDFIVRTPSKTMHTVQVKTVRKAQAIHLDKRNFAVTSSSFLIITWFDNTFGPITLLFDARDWHGSPASEAKYLSMYKDKADNDFWVLHLDEKFIATFGHKYAFTSRVEAILKA
jgi:hypothetical protein